MHFKRLGRRRKGKRSKMSSSCSLKRRQKISILTLGSSIGPIKLPQVEINALFLSNDPISETVFGAPIR